MVAPIVAVGVGAARNVAIKILTSEGAVLGKAWWGFKSKREIVAGIRTGLGLGAAIGSFINDQNNPFEDAKIPSRDVAPPYKFSKGNRRFRTTGSYRRNIKYCRPRKFRK